MILGIHVSRKDKLIKNPKNRSLYEAIKEDTEKLGINAVQIFVANPHTGVTIDLSDKDVFNIKQLTHDIDLSVHSSYVDVGIWKINETNFTEAKMQNALSRIKRQLDMCNKLGAHCFVLHIPKVEIQTISASMKYLLPLAKQFNVKIGLEMVASKADPKKTYETPQRLDALVDQIISDHGQDFAKHFGIVVDTAHIWAAGVDARGAQAMKTWFDKLRNKNMIILFHLNGSLKDRGFGRDTHAIPFCEEDKIWGNLPIHDTGAYTVIKFAVKNNVPLICEMNFGSEAQAIESLRTIMSIEST